MMKISKNDLKETLSIAQATLGNGPDITSHFLFEVVKGEVFVSACNLPRIYSSIPLKGVKIDQVENEEGETVSSFQSFTLEGKRVLQAIDAVGGLLSIEVEEGQVSIISEKGTVDLSSLDPTAFPPWRDMLKDAQKQSQVPSGVLHDTLLTSKPFAHTNEAEKPELAQVYVKDGMAFACDGFGLSMAKSDSFKDLDIKFHIKDISPAVKFLKAHEGHSIEVLKSDKAIFLKTEDGAIFGLMDVPFDMPKPITEKYVEAFDWTPRRVWRMNKSDFANALKFLSSGAEETNLKVKLIDSEAETFSPPKLEMDAYNGRSIISYSLDPVNLSVELTDDFDLNTIEDIGERMYASRLLKDKNGETEGEDIEFFHFNIDYMKRSLDVTSNVITFGCNREGERGYMLFKQATSSGVEIVSILGWMV